MVPRKKSISILYVDDERPLLELTKSYLESKGDFEVEICNCPEEALGRIRDSTFDAIISDYQMPIMDGIELLKHVRNENIDTPFIIFTGRGREEVAINALNNGADFYIQKGGDVKTQFAELMNSINTCVSGHRARCDLRLSESSLKTLADNMSEPVVILNKERRISYANPSFTYCSGYGIKDLMGRSFSDFSRDVEMSHRSDDTKDELHLENKDGSLTHMEVSEAEVMYDGDIADMLFLRDVTSKRLVEKGIMEAHKKMVSMFDSIVDPIYVSDMDDHTVLYANKALQSLYDINIIGRKCHDILQGKDAPCDFCTNPIIRDESQRPHIWEHHNKNLDHYYRIIDNVIEWPDGRNVRFEMTCDITDMKNAEKQAEESTGRIKTILKAVPDTMFTIDRQGIVTDSKPRPEGTSVKTWEAAAGSDIRTMFGNDQAETILSTVNRAFDTGSVETCRYSMTTEEGLTHYTARLVRFSEDEVLAVVSDITSLRNTMDKMEESERLHRVLFENAPLSVKVHELDSLDVVYANPKALEYLGFADVAELIEDGVPWTSAPFSKEDAMEISSELLTQKAMEFDWLTARRDGSTFWERVNLVLMEYEGRTRLLNFSYDITTSKESFDELYRSKERYKALIASSNTGAWEYDMVNDRLWTSDEYFTMLGHDPRDFAEGHDRTTKWLELMHPDDRIGADNVFHGYFTNPGDGMYENFFRLRRSDGGWSWIWSRGKALTDNAGDYNGIIVGTHIDITPMRELENSLRENEHRYKTLANTGKALIYTTDRKGGLTYVNDVVKEYTGLRVEDHLADKWIELIHPEDREGAIETHIAGISSRKPFTIKFRLRRHDGTYRWMIDEGMPRHDADGDYIGYIGHCMDVNDMVGLEKALTRTNDKLKLMTGVTRHDLLNQLVVLSGFIELSKDSACSDDVLHNLGMMENAVKAMYRHIDFTRDYEALGAKDSEWQSFSDIICRQRSNKISIIDELEGLDVLGDPLLERAVHNLIDNTIKHGGDVTRMVFDHVSTDDGSLVIGCADDGIGIVPDEKEMIFEKGYGKNHGLGLFLIRDILSITGITIREVGVFGEGARFEIVVPPGSYRFR